MKLLLAFFIPFTFNLSAQINWVSFEEALTMQQKAPKKIFVDVYTNWCGWCKKMDKSTFQDPNVAKYMNDNFYAVKLNAESRDTFRVKDKQFVYKQEYKANELALNLLYGKMGYPTIVVIDETNKTAHPHPGYKQPAGMMQILKFYAEDHYKSKTLKEFQKEG